MTREIYSVREFVRDLLLKNSSAVKTRPMGLPCRSSLKRLLNLAFEELQDPSLTALLSLSLPDTVLDSWNLDLAFS